MLSILIPTFNTDLNTLLSQLLDQKKTDDFNYEIIFCEDASTEYVESNYKVSENKNVVRIVNEVNMGREQTRQVLANSANYDWLLFLDADTLPVNKENFVLSLKEHILNQIEVVYGGIVYQENEVYKKNLRWRFGTEREQKTVEERQKNPYLSINSGCICIKKELFLKINQELNYQVYGLDILFSYILKIQKVTIKHIDNPVYHLGLEDNETFIKKSLKAIETIYELEKTDNLNSEYSRLQKVYKKLESLYLLKSISVLIKSNQKRIYKNISGDTPSLFLYDLYRLHHYIKLKRNA